MVTITSCKKNEETSKKQEATFDIKAASNLVEAYMNAVENGNMENIKKFYSAKLLKNVVASENKEFKVVGFNILETSKVGESGLFKIRVARSSTVKPLASLDEYVIKVIKEGFDYKIDDTNNIGIKEAFPEYSEIRLKSKNNVNTNLLFDMDTIPNYAFSKDDKANMLKLPVPKSNFGIMAFSYNGDMLALTTFDSDSFIGYVKINEAMEVQNAGKEEGAGGGGKSTDKTQSGNAREKPVGKELIILDLIKGSKIEFITFSQDEKYIGLEYNKASFVRCIRVYKTDNGDMIDYKFEEKFPINLVDVNFSSFDKEVINFDVVAKNPSDKSLNDYIGKWQLNIKELKSKKI